MWGDDCRFTRRPMLSLFAPARQLQEKVGALEASQRALAGEKEEAEADFKALKAEYKTLKAKAAKIQTTGKKLQKKVLVVGEK